MLTSRRKRAPSLRLSKNSLRHPRQLCIRDLYELITLSFLIRAALCYTLLRISYARYADITGYCANPRTQPTRFFKTWQRGDVVYLLRSRQWPYRFTVQGGLTKQFVRTQPIPALRDSIIRPAQYGCSKSAEHPMVFVGVFSTATRWSRRSLLRTYEKPVSDLVHGAKVEFKFILGKPADQNELNALHREMDRHGDIVLLDQMENMNNGKTHAFYRYLTTRAEPMPQFAFKADDDVRKDSLSDCGVFADLHAHRP